MSSAICFNLDQFKMLLSGNGLNILECHLLCRVQISPIWTNLKICHVVIIKTPQLLFTQSWSFFTKNYLSDGMYVWCSDIVFQSLHGQF